jgi:glycosyltransferase involved in cell wall biosynthesis
MQKPLRGRQLKLLIVSWYFPPVNTIGALRLGPLARFLIERGHDVGVVAGKFWGHPETLPLGVSLERVVYAHSFDVNAPPARLQRWLRSRPRAAQAASVHDSSSRSATLPSDGAKSPLRRASEFYVNLTNVPDNHVGWLPWAYGAGRTICRHWRPDLILGSGPPFTALVAAAMLSARLRVPWVAELRDRWADDPYGDIPAWRLRLDQWLERRTLSTTSGLVTVTEPWAEFYRRKYDKPVATIYNGYDPLDFAEPLARAPASEHVLIGYTGGIYPGKRDPTPLFLALRLLGESGKRFRVIFCGTAPSLVAPLAERAGVQDLVEVRNSVPHKQSIEFQSQCDVLLLMQWNDPREQGNCPGKFFEYMGSLRPVLILGLKNGVPATIVGERSAGVCANEPEAIADRLRQWLSEKEEFGRVRPLPEAAREGLSRPIQFKKLEDFLEEIVASAGAATRKSVRA